MKFLITGGAGFIGSAVVRLLISSTKHTVLNLDKLTYAGNLQSLESISDSNRYLFERADICDKTRVFDIFKDYYNITNKGLWEHGDYIQLRGQTKQEIAKKHKISVINLDIG